MTATEAKAGNAQLVARAGKHFVAAELLRRGAYDVTFAGNEPASEIVASNLDQAHIAFIYVKTKQTGSWQASTTQGSKSAAMPDEDRFWIFVDLCKPGLEPHYYVCYESWIQNDIYETHRAYLKKHGGARPATPTSTHHSIKQSRIEEWRDRWDLLGIL